MVSSLSFEPSSSSLLVFWLFKQKVNRDHFKSSLLQTLSWFCRQTSAQLSKSRLQCSALLYIHARRSLFFFFFLCAAGYIWTRTSADVPLIPLIRNIWDYLWLKCSPQDVCQPAMFPASRRLWLSLHISALICLPAIAPLHLSSNFISSLFCCLLIYVLPPQSRLSPLQSSRHGSRCLQPHSAH